MIGEALYAPRVNAGVCSVCFTFIGPDYERCVVCRNAEQHLAAVAPIAYSVAGGSLHRDIVSYKRDADPSVDSSVNRLALLLGQFLDAHEGCVARAAGVGRFDLVTTVPSDRGLPGGERHPLERIVATRLLAVASRYQPLLARTPRPARRRHFDPDRFIAGRCLDGERILLLDDMWTTGASAQSAAAALRAAGSGPIAAVVVGRHLNPGWADNEQRLHELAVPLDFGSCVICVSSTGGAERRPGPTGSEGPWPGDTRLSDPHLSDSGPGDTRAA